MLGRLLNPRNDWMFKRLFGEIEHKDMTIHFINTLLGGTQPPVVDVEFLKIELGKDVAELRQSIVDVLCRAEDGRQFVVEMQRSSDDFFIQRLVRYASQVYINQHRTMLKKPKDRGGYCKFHPVICLAVMERTLFPKKEDFLSHRELRDIKTFEHDIEDISFTFLELSKFTKTYEELETDLDRWAYYLKNADTVSQEELEKILAENSIFSKAYRALSEASYTLEEYMAYLSFDLKQEEIEVQKDEAEAKGKAEGLAEGKKQIALKMLKKGMSFQEVAELTGLLEGELRILVS